MRPTSSRRWRGGRGTSATRHLRKQGAKTNKNAKQDNEVDSRRESHSASSESQYYTLKSRLESLGSNGEVGVDARPPNDPQAKSTNRGKLFTKVTEDLKNNVE